MVRSGDQYRVQPRVQCECGEAVNIDRYQFHLTTKKHINKVSGLSRSDRARIRYQSGEYCECSCGTMVNRYYIMKHLRESQQHKRGQNPIDVKELAEFIAFNRAGHKL
jgi:hypothetical protein